MGNRLNSIINRLFDYPIKRKPICFYRQEDFSSTGEPLPQEEVDLKVPPTEYDKLLQSFYDKLLTQRKLSRQMQDKDKRWSIQKLLIRFPGWNEMTVANLHSLFLLFDNLNGMLTFQDFAAVLESLGDENSTDVRKKKFDAADTDADGCINYDEYLLLIYNFDSPKSGELVGLSKLCFEIAENIRFVSNLSVGEQLEYGLF